MLPLEKATQTGTKIHNQNLVFNTIYDHVEISRADVARKTGLTRTSVTEIVSHLIQEGLLDERKTASTGMGRPPILLRVKENSRHIIGIDLAADEFRGAIVNLRGKIIHREIIPLINQNCDNAVAQTYEIIDKLLTMMGRPLLGIGIGTPGVINRHHGIVSNSVNLDWHDFPLGELLQERYKIPVYIDNDCKAAALAEFTLGDYENKKNLLLIKSGRGVGSGIILNRQLYYGDSYSSGEIGHLKVIDGGNHCHCGNNGCLETLVSSPAIITRARDVALQNPDSVINSLISNLDEINIDLINQAFKAGDNEIRRLIEQVGQYLGISIAYVINILDINTIILSGDLINFGEALINIIQQCVKRGTLPESNHGTRVYTSKLGNDIVILGASSLLLSNELALV